jgi:hypothetical protein
MAVFFHSLSFTTILSSLLRKKSSTLRKKMSPPHFYMTVRLQCRYQRFWGIRRLHRQVREVTYRWRHHVPPKRSYLSNYMAWHSRRHWSSRLQIVRTRCTTSYINYTNKINDERYKNSMEQVKWVTVCCKVVFASPEHGLGTFLVPRILTYS